MVATARSVGGRLRLVFLDLRHDGLELGVASEKDGTVLPLFVTVLQRGLVLLLAPLEFRTGVQRLLRQ